MISESIGTDEAVSSEEDGTKPLSPAGDKTDEALLDKSPVIAGTRTRIVEPVAPPQSENGAHPPGSDSSTGTPLEEAHEPGFNPEAPADSSVEGTEEESVEQLPPEIDDSVSPPTHKPNFTTTDSNNHNDDGNKAKKITNAVSSNKTTKSLAAGTKSTAETLPPHVVSTLTDLMNKATENLTTLEDNAQSAESEFAEESSEAFDDELNTQSSLVPPTTTPQASSTSQIPKKVTTVVPSSTEDPLKKAVFANHGVENVEIDPAFAHLQDITQLEDKYPREKVIKETLEVKSMQEAELRPRTHGVKTDAGEKQQLKRIEIAPRGTLTHQHIAASHDSAPDKAKSVTHVDTPSADGNDSTPQITGTNSEFEPPPAPVLISTGMQNEEEAMADLSDWSLEQHNGNVAPPGGFPEVNAAGRSIFEPDETLPDAADLASAGREPVPRRPTGIAQAPAPELKDLGKKYKPSR